MTWTPTKPLSPEEVAKLRVPDWFELVPISKYQGDLTFEVLCKDKWQGQVTEERRESAFGKPRSEVILAYLAENIANGHLPTEALDAVWAIVEGNPSRETELLRAVVKADNLVYATMASMVLSHGDGPVVERATAKRFDDATKALRESIETARKWIEEQKP